MFRDGKHYKRRKTLALLGNSAKQSARVEWLAAQGAA
jgi:hypothetical protein